MSFGLLKTGIVQQAHISDADPYLINFWTVAATEPEKLIADFMSEPLSRERAEWWRSVEPESLDDQTRALQALYINRSSFGGSFFMSGIRFRADNDERVARGEARETLSELFQREKVAAGIRQVAEWHGTGRLTISHRDYTSAAADAPDGSLIYLDPPYVVKGSKLYTHVFNDQDHKQLAETVYALSETHSVAVSYDDHPLVRDLYSEPPMLFHHPSWSYCMTRGVGRNSAELLITNFSGGSFEKQPTRRTSRGRH